jgi:hypothetical protein
VALPVVDPGPDPSPATDDPAPEPVLGVVDPVRPRPSAPAYSAPVSAPAPVAPGPALPAAGPAPTGGDFSFAPSAVDDQAARPDAPWRWPLAAPTLAKPSKPGLGGALVGFTPAAAALAVPGVSPPHGSRTSGPAGGGEPSPGPSVGDPLPLGPLGPASPVSAAAGAGVGIAGGIGGLSLAVLGFLLLALAAPRRLVSRPAHASALSLRPVYAPARAPPAS